MLQFVVKDLNQSSVLCQRTSGFTSEIRAMRMSSTSKFNPIWQILQGPHLWILIFIFIQPNCFLDDSSTCLCEHACWLSVERKLNEAPTSAAYLNSCFRKIDFIGKSFTCKNIWIVSPFKFYNRKIKLYI